MIALCVQYWGFSVFSCRCFIVLIVVHTVLPACRRPSLAVRHWQPTLGPRPAEGQSHQDVSFPPRACPFACSVVSLPPRPPDKLDGSLTRLGEAGRSRRNRVRSSPFLSASIGDAGIDRRRERSVAPISSHPPPSCADSSSITAHTYHRIPTTIMPTAYDVRMMLFV